MHFVYLYVNKFFLQLEIKMQKLQLIPKFIELYFLKINVKLALYYNVNLIIVQF